MMTKKTLLASVAMVALIAAPAFAQRQEAPPSRTESPARAPDAMQNAPAEKTAPPVRGRDSKSPMKSETTGQASPSGRSSEDPAKSQAKPGTSGQATPSGKSGETGTKAAPAPTERSGNDARSGATTDTKPSGSAQAPAGQKKAAGGVALTTEQKSKIRSTVLTANAPRVTSVNFSVNVGTVVPKSVRLVTVPTTLVEIHPAWRGFMYFVYNDQIVIVEPGTLKIVTIIEV